jgi:tetratricopeptide (TPR) repeat protein
LKGVVSLSDILQAYGVTGEKVEAQAVREEIGASRRLVPGVIAAGLAVLLVIGFLNYYYRSARSQRAEQYYKTGSALLQQDRDDEAVQQFRDALSGAPGNPQYRLALGLALAKANHLEEASVYLNALLKRDPGNALANLGQARIAAAQGKPSDAVKFYRQVLKTDDRNADAYAGLGSAELALENYPDARDAFQKAVEQNPSDQMSKQQLDLCERVLALDPNVPGLIPAQRLERSKEVLQAEVMRFERCQPGHQALASDSADTNLTLAEDLWKQEQKLCATPNPEDPVARVLARLAKQ